MHEYRTRRRIEFSDTDLAGIVHFSRFFVFMEAAEHEFLNLLGTSVNTEIDGERVGWPRLAASCEYFQPAKFEEELVLHLEVLRKGTKSMTYGVEFWRQDDLIARGKIASACCVLRPGERPRAREIPKFIAVQVDEAPARESADGGARKSADQTTGQT